MNDKTRLDQLLTDRSLTPSRSRARDAILRGVVRVDGQIVTKPSFKVSQNVEIELSDPIEGYVSRAALKLVHALDHFKLTPKDLICADIGASTGGFTQVLLERYAKRVYAIDVGNNQFHKSLSNDPRIRLLENLNARDICSATFEELPKFFTCDVSFISVKLALKALLQIVPTKTIGIILIKPQFEVGKRYLNKKGIVDHGISKQVSIEISNWFSQKSEWNCLGITTSPILGSSGNQEYLLAVERI